jgi:uncharacterized DUF497 family protein
MYLKRLEIEADRADHIWRHHVTATEVSEVIANGFVSRAASTGRYLLVGQTDGGRYLAIYIGKRDEPGVYGLITARDAESRERRWFQSTRSH